MINASKIKSVAEFIKNLKRRKLILFLFDTLTMIGVWFVLMFFFLLAERSPFSAEYLPKNLANLGIFWALIMVARLFGGVYRNVWRYATAQLYLWMVVMDFSAGFVGGIGLFLLARKTIYFGTWETVSFVTMFDIACLVSRFGYQCFYQFLKVKSTGTNRIVVAIVGAGQIGATLAQDLMVDHSSHYIPVCFIDSDKAKVKSKVLGLPVYEDGEGVLEKLQMHSVQEVFIAVPKSSEKFREVVDFYSKSGCKVKVFALPSEEEEGKPKLQEVKIEDLLGRQAKQVMTQEAKEFYSGKTVLVTGGGGSIGSEICRQLAKRGPKQLIVFDIYENNAYDLQQELIRKYGNSLNLAVEIGSVRDRARLEAVFAHYRPDLVFHAAAHKHVPLMEHSNCEAIKNNILGTYNSADMAEKYGVKKFILVSTDKAVNPTNIMGASKRMCEMVIQCRKDSKTTAFAAVRFGNVLGSNGSVIPLFRRQIEAGGPVTITDKRIIRYFMTIPEASRLVMQAGAMAKAGELFVLDMGKPVKILDLAENMIRLSGLRPYEDIKIEEIGLRPGEKLYEELLIKTEDLDRTDNEMIFVERDTPPTREQVEEKLVILKNAVENAKNEIASGIIEKAMKSVVPTYRSPEEVNREAEKSEEMKLVH